MNFSIPLFIAELYDRGLISEAGSTTIGAWSIIMESLIDLERPAAAGLTKHDTDADRERRASKSN